MKTWADPGNLPVRERSHVAECDPTGADPCGARGLSHVRGVTNFLSIIAR